MHQPAVQLAEPVLAAVLEGEQERALAGARRRGRRSARSTPIAAAPGNWSLLDPGPHHQRRLVAMRERHAIPGHRRGIFMRNAGLQRIGRSWARYQRRFRGEVEAEPQALRGTRVDPIVESPCKPAERGQQKRTDKDGQTLHRRGAYHRVACR